MTEHVVQPAAQVSHPGGKDGFWRATCSCGGYSTGYHAYESQARRAAQNHADAKNGTRRAD